LEQIGRREDELPWSVDLPGVNVLLQVAASSRSEESRMAHDRCIAGDIVGSGVKNLILSGLRDYQQDAIDGMVADYLTRAG
jgi:hypothetical protein